MPAVMNDKQLCSYTLNGETKSFSKEKQENTAGQ